MGNDEDPGDGVRLAADVVTITDVAAAAGVSIRTVSRVLNGSPKVGKETRRHIQAHIDRLAFRPNSRARGLAAGRSFLIGVVQDDPNAHVISVFQRGIVEVCSDQGYELVVHPSGYDDPDVVRNVQDFARRSRVDGVILLPPLSELEGLAEALRDLKLPAVAMAAVRVPAHPVMLVSDERGAAGALADHLVALGHRRIAIVTGPMRFRSAAERLIGFQSALSAHGVVLPAEYIREGDYGFASGLNAGGALLGLRDPPTAVFAGNDIMAAGVMKAANQAGVAVPARLSVVGFDDSDIAGMVTPALSTIRRPLAEMARSATLRLLHMIGGADVAVDDKRIDLHLIERESIAPPFHLQDQAAAE